MSPRSSGTLLGRQPLNQATVTLFVLLVNDVRAKIVYDTIFFFTLLLQSDYELPISEMQKKNWGSPNLFSKQGAWKTTPILTNQSS